jgi:hypothetical protein
MGLLMLALANAANVIPKSIAVRPARNAPFIARRNNLST